MFLFFIHLLELIHQDTLKNQKAFINDSMLVEMYLT